MALTHDRVVEMARQAKALADHLKAAHTLMSEFLRTNSNLAIDWGAQATPAYIREDAGGNIDGGGSILFSRQQVANLIGTFAAVTDLLDGEAVSQGNYLDNVNVVAAASVTAQR